MYVASGILAGYHRRLRVVSLIALLGLWSNGCTTQPALWPITQANVHNALMARRSTMPPSEDVVLNSLPDRTVADYEAEGDRHHQQGNLTLAFVNYDKALRLDPSQKRIQYKQGRLYLHKGLLVDATQVFRELMTKYPDYALAHEGLGQALLRSGDLVKAETSCARAVELDPSLWLSYNCLGVAYDHDGRYSNAIQAYQAAIVLKPKQSLLFNNLGMSYYLQKDYMHAEQAFRQALSLNDRDSKVYNNLGLVLSKEGRDQEALDHFTKGSNRVKAHNNLGVIYLADGKPQEAIQFFEKAITLSPVYYEKASQNLILARRAMAGPPLRQHPVGGTLNGRR